MTNDKQRELERELEYLEKYLASADSIKDLKGIIRELINLIRQQIL